METETRTEIVTDGSWHTARVWHDGPLSDAAALSRGARVRWRTQRVQCCGQTIVIANGTAVPVWINDPHGLTGHVSQCGSCGALYTANFARVAEA